MRWFRVVAALSLLSSSYAFAGTHEAIDQNRRAFVYSPMQSKDVPRKLLILAKNAANYKKYCDSKDDLYSLIESEKGLALMGYGEKPDPVFTKELAKTLQVVTRESLGANEDAAIDKILKLLTAERIGYLLDTTDGKIISYLHAHPDQKIMVLDTAF